VDISQPNVASTLETCLERMVEAQPVQDDGVRILNLHAST
jgi:hypothetical protein